MTGYNDRLLVLQYIVKPPASAKSSFAWHRDSDWCMQDTHDCSGYLSLWCALDDMTPGDTV